MVLPARRWNEAGAGLPAAVRPAQREGQGAEVGAGADWMEAGGPWAGQACAWQCKPDFVLGSGCFISRRVSAVPLCKTWLAALPCNLFDRGNFFDRLPCDFLIYQIEFNNSLLLSPFISPLGFTYDCCLSYPFEALNLFSNCEELSSVSACIMCKNMQQNCCCAWELINVSTEGNGRINQACSISRSIPIKFSGTDCQQDTLQKFGFVCVVVFFFSFISDFISTPLLKINFINGFRIKWPLKRRTSVRAKLNKMK